MKKKLLAFVLCFVMVLSVLPMGVFTASAEELEPVKYIDRTWDDANKQVVETEKECTDYIVVDENTASFEDGKWYVVNSDVTNRNRITVTGTANLILCDDITMTASSDITLYDDDSTLNIYGQTNDTGSLSLTAADNYGIGGTGGSIAIHGGNVTVNAFIRSSIGAENVVIYGGNVSAKSFRGSGISGNVVIYGGDVFSKSTYGKAIGAVSDSSEGTLTVADGMIIKAGDSEPGIKVTTEDILNNEYKYVSVTKQKQLTTDAIKNVMAKSDNPQSGIVEIEYTVDGEDLVKRAKEAGWILSLEVSAKNTKTGEVYTKNYDANFSQGKHYISCDLVDMGAEEGVKPGDFEFTVACKTEQAQYCVIDLSGGYMANYPITYLSKAPEDLINREGEGKYEHLSTKYTKYNIVFRRIEAGTYKTTDLEYGSDGKQYDVTITKPFYIGVFELTQGQWDQIKEPDIDNHRNAFKPKIYISTKLIRGGFDGLKWPNSDEIDFEPNVGHKDSLLGFLRNGTGLKVDLPTSAQWELAYRAGTSTMYYWGDDVEQGHEYEYFDGTRDPDDPEYFAPVGMLKPNAYGLYDMAGNVRELCLDRAYEYVDSPLQPCYYGTDPVGPTIAEANTDYRIYRGGTYYSSPEYVQASYRSIGMFGRDDYGCRLAFPLSEEEDFIGTLYGTTVSISSGWNITPDGTLIITGEVVNNSTTSDNTPWKEYKAQIKAVVAKEGAKINDCSRMFSNCTNLTSVDIKKLDTSEVKSMQYMFSGCSSLETLDLTGLDTSSLNSTMCMFYNASALKSINFTGFNTAGVWDMQYMFRNCASLTELDLSSFDTSRVTTMSTMFYDCTSLETLDISNFNCNALSNTDFIFGRCQSLKKVLTNDNALQKFAEPLVSAGIVPVWYNDVTTEKYQTTDDLKAIEGKVTLVQSVPFLFDSISLVLSGELGLNFYTVVNDVEAVKDGYMLFEIGSSAEQTVNFSDAKLCNDGRCVFTCNVNALQMADTITVTFHFGDTVVGPRTITVAGYIDKVIAKHNNDDTDPTVKLAKAIVNYGHYAQLAQEETRGFAIGTDYAETTNLSDVAIANAEDLAQYKATKTGNIDGITYISRSLSLDHGTDINLYFTAADDYAPTVAVTDKSGKAVDCSFEQQADGRYLLVIPQIAAHQLGDMYTVTVDGTMTISVSALSYAYSVLASGKTDAQKQAVSALYEYYKATAAYKSEQGEESTTERKNIEAEVIQIISNQLEIDESMIHLDSNLTLDLGVDEEDMKDILRELQEVFGVDFSEKMIASFITVEDIIRQINSL